MVQHILSDCVYSHCSSCSSSKWSSSSLAGEAELGARGRTGFSPSALTGEGEVIKGSGSKVKWVHCPSLVGPLSVVCGFAVCH